MLDTVENSIKAKKMLDDYFKKHSNNKNTFNKKTKKTENKKSK